MQQTKFVNLPIIGRVQHGEKIKNKVIEYGYFIAKSDDAYMKPYLDKFDQLFKGKPSIEIEFFSEDPLSKKYARYNQSGEVCSCPEGYNIANQRVKNGWQQINCDTFNCQYRQKNEQGKCACNRIGWLKFLIPDVSTDRIFLMRITGQTSMNKLDDYMKLQKVQGKSIKGRYIIFLKQIEQSNSLGQTFNNYVLDILKKEDFIQTKQIPETNQNSKEISTINDKNVNSKIEKQEQNSKSDIQKQKIENTEIAQTIEQTENKTANATEAKETTKAKRQTKSKTKKAEEKTTETKETKAEEKQDIESYENYYVFESLSSETINTKLGPKEYTIGKFYDMQDKPYNIVLKPDYATELKNCELGTIVQFLETKEINGRDFAIDLKFIQKMEKNIAA